MSQTAVIIAVLCLTTSVMNAQRLLDFKSLPSKTSFDLDDLRSLIQTKKRNFRFHAARGKKYGYIPSRGKKIPQVDVIDSAHI
ncbi:hypothetical protein KIN20_009595 [Parelaphostrongylus tenuis]|uniref:Uncharacterized protein n=1 Tax=Parelaphostrongylus tenuis TaxID=148309 RepID=A0AAD5QKQ8_PARTN|nr:hypothetical protein KIN20_009595 [Parelaphostrongylus tenuis]